MVHELDLFEVAAAWRSEGRRVALATVVATWAQYFPRLLELRGDQGATVLLDDLADQIFEVEMPDDAVLVDIDTLAALDAVLTRFAQAEATQDVH